MRDLTDTTNPRMYDVKSGKPYLSAVGFLQYLQDETKDKKVNAEELNEIIAKYFDTYSLTNSSARDADTKQALWQEVLGKIHDYNIVDKLNNLKVCSSLNEYMQCNSQSTAEHRLSVNL